LQILGEASDGNGHGQAAVAWDAPRPPVPPSLLAPPQARGSFLLAAILFALTLLSTLAVGAQFALDYAAGRPPFAEDFNPWGEMFREPGLLLMGLPFSFTLVGILLAHELGHFFACRYYGIAASYPYFLPAPTIIGTLGAFIRIRSPIVNRKALFDVGLAGPVVGFLFAAPAFAVGLAFSKIIPGAQTESPVVFGQPLLGALLIKLLYPDARVADVFLHPIARAAWVGLFATALNLLPIGQLDGGHVLYSLASEKHRKISLAFVMLLIPLGVFFWHGWLMWAALLLFLGFRHPALLDRWEPIDGKRRVWAVIALVIFALCFMPAPFTLNLD
jgi:membrane-associated protease RseP (regulator of RpoE activity)